MDMSEVEGINMLDVDERPLNQRPDVEGIDMAGIHMMEVEGMDMKGIHMMEVERMDMV
jgi:hypothetical protein